MRSEIARWGVDYTWTDLDGWFAEGFLLEEQALPDVAFTEVTDQMIQIGE